MTNISKPVPEGPGVLATLGVITLSCGMFATAGVLAGKSQALGSLTTSDWVTIFGMGVTLTNAAVLAGVAYSQRDKRSR